MKKHFLAAALVLMMAVSPLTTFGAEKDAEKADGMKMAEVLKAADGMGGTVTMNTMPGGITYGREVYDLGNGNVLIMEFEEGEDGLKSFIEDDVEPALYPQATNGEKVWKDYGNRYFTAKSSVFAGMTQGSLVLENHYTLSKNGIDERYGITDGSPQTGANYVEPGGAVITKSSARTIGSEVRMYADYRVTSKVGSTPAKITTYRLSTTVGYIDHNASNGQVKVQHSWTLNTVG